MRQNLVEQSVRPPSRYARAARQPCDIYLWQMGGFAARLRVMYLEPPVLLKMGGVAWKVKGSEQTYKDWEVANLSES